MTVSDRTLLSTIFAGLVVVGCNSPTSEATKMPKDNSWTPEVRECLRKVIEERVRTRGGLSREMLERMRSSSSTADLVIAKRRFMESSCAAEVACIGGPELQRSVLFGACLRDANSP
jgi:hypothetical protein